MDFQKRAQVEMSMTYVGRLISKGGRVDFLHIRILVLKYFSISGGGRVDFLHIKMLVLKYLLISRGGRVDFLHIRMRGPR